MGSGLYGIVVVDDHPIVREGIAMLLSSHPDFEVVGDAADATSAERVVAACSPEAVIIDVELGRDSGLSLMRSLRAENPSLAIIALSMHDDRIYAERALRAGANGYVMKEEATSLLLETLNRVREGEIVVSPHVRTRLLRTLSDGRPSVEERAPISALTDREYEIFRLIGLGHATGEIAEHLHISPKTVEAHRARIKSKLGFQKASELVAHAARWVSTERVPKQ